MKSNFFFFYFISTAAESNSTSTLWGRHLRDPQVQLPPFKTLRKPLCFRSVVSGVRCNFLMFGENKIPNSCQHLRYLQRLFEQKSKITVALMCQTFLYVSVALSSYISCKLRTWDTSTSIFLSTRSIHKHSQASQSLPQKTTSYFPFINISVIFSVYSSFPSECTNSRDAAGCHNTIIFYSRSRGS